MTERAYKFGAHGGLVGILSEPDADDRRVGAPAVLFSNIGLNHRVGPNRLYVGLARRLAAAGFTTLRFDLSGFGDSEPRRDGGTDIERAVLDTRDAMDFCEKRGIHRFVLVGLCSGVDSMYHTALQDRRVAGGIFIEGYAYRNAGFWLRYLTIRNLQPHRWLRFARVRLARLSGHPPMVDPNDDPEVFERGFPSREQFAADLKTLTGRGVRMLFIYTSNADGCYNYRGQFHDAFGYRDSIDVEYFTRADHVFSTEAYRDLLLERLVQWMDNQFPRSVRSSAAPLRSTLCLVGPAMMSMSRLLNIASETNLIAW